MAYNRPEKGHGFIYVMADMEHGVVKIGWTGAKHHGPRLVALQSHYPFDLEPLVVFEGSRQDEAQLLAFFTQYKTRPDRMGEWFFAADPVLAFIETMGGGTFGKTADLGGLWRFTWRRNIMAERIALEDARLVVERLA